MQASTAACTPGGATTSPPSTAARTAWAADGRLNGPEIEAPGGRRYAAGDRIVTLAPGAGGAIVTSERGTVTAVDADRRQLMARMDDGRDQLFAAEDMTADRLDHGYAITVHRAQGATVDTAHRFHDGGGRELAYVAMSRARQQTTVHVVADDVDQAVEDLQRDWTHEHRPRWAIDTGTPETNALRAERSPTSPSTSATTFDEPANKPRHDARGEVPTPETAPSPALLRQRLDDAHRQLVRLERCHRPLRRPRAHRRRRRPHRRPESPRPRRADHHRPRPQLAPPTPLAARSRSQPNRRTRRHHRLDHPRRTPPPAPQRPDPPARGHPPITARPTRPRPADRRSTRPSNNSSEQSSTETGRHLRSYSSSGGPYPAPSDRSTPRTSALGSSCAVGPKVRGRFVHAAPYPRVSRVRWIGPMAGLRPRLRGCPPPQRRCNVDFDRWMTLRLGVGSLRA